VISPLFADKRNITINWPINR